MNHQRNFISWILGFSVNCFYGMFILWGAGKSRVVRVALHGMVFFLGLPCSHRCDCTPHSPHSRACSRAEPASEPSCLGLGANGNVQRLSFYGSPACILSERNTQRGSRAVVVSRSTRQIVPKLPHPSCQHLLHRIF